MHNTTLSGKNIYDVSTGENLGIRMSVEFLVSKGIREIAFIQDYDTSAARAKHDSYRETLDENGIDYRKGLVIHTESGIEGGMEAVNELEIRGVSYAALTGCDDISALGSMRGLADIGRRVPEDVAVIGYNNTVFSSLAEPRMTVVDNREEATGLALSRVMIDILRGKNVPFQTVISPELIVRGSA